MEWMDGREGWMDGSGGGEGLLSQTNPTRDAKVKRQSRGAISRRGPCLPSPPSKGRAASIVGLLGSLRKKSIV